MISKENFLLICRKCDELLLSRDASIYRVSIPWLNLIRPHPIFLKNYLKVFVVSNSFSSFFDIIWGVTYAIFKFIFSFACGLLNRRVFQKVKYREFYDVILVSHLVNSSQFNSEDDLYFGSMPCELKKAGYTVLVVLIDQRINKDLVIDDNIINHNNYDIITLGWRMSFHYYLKNFVLFLKEFATLFYKTFSSKTLIEKKIAFNSALDSLISGPGTLLIADQVAFLVKCFKVKFLITTFEGHSYEKLIFARSRVVNSQLCCMGYQHATLFNLQHGIERRLGKQYEPDVVLASGEVSKTEFEIFSGNWQTLLIGSKRTGILTDNIKCNNFYNTCLVLPEAFDSEVLKLFCYSLDCAEKLKNINFIWRLHPAFSLDRLRAMDARFTQLPHNISLSKKTLKEDALESDLALYRGSSSVIEAVTFGAIPIYLSDTNEISINPLYRDKSAHLTVSNISDFEAVLERYYAQNDVEINLIKKKAIDHCLQIFTPMQVKSLLDYMKIKNLDCIC